MASNVVRVSQTTQIPIPGFYIFLSFQFEIDYLGLNFAVNFTMAQPSVLRILASSVSLANHAGKIVRDVLSGGNLGIVEKEVSIEIVLFIYIGLNIAHSCGKGTTFQVCSIAL